MPRRLCTGARLPTTTENTSVPHDETLKYGMLLLTPLPNLVDGVVELLWVCSVQISHDHGLQRATLGLCTLADASKNQCCVIRLRSAYVLLSAPIRAGSFRISML